MSLRGALVEIDALVAALTPPQREAMRCASVEIAAALTNLGTAIPDGTTSPISAAVQSALASAAMTWRPGKGFSGLKPKLAAALVECPTLRDVAREFFAKLAPPSPPAGP